jgi:hypothetical protein
MGRLKVLENKVRKILVSYPETRNDDNVLIYQYLKEYHDIDLISVKDLFLNGRKLGIPSFESITRCRRKIQEHSPYLRCTEKIDKIRYTHTLKIRDYLEGKDEITGNNIGCEIARKLR